MKKVIFPDTQEDLQKYQDRLKAFNIEFKLVSEDGKVGLEFDQDQYRAAVEAQKQAAKPKKLSFFERYRQMPFWVRLVIGLFAIGITYGIITADVPESEPAEKEPVVLLFDAKAAFNASPEYFEKLWGAPTSSEESKSIWSCGKEPCAHSTYKDGNYEVWFRDGKAIHIVVSIDTKEVHKELIKNLGLSVSEPDNFYEHGIDPDKGIMEWYNEDGMMVIINSVIYSIRDLKYLPKDLKEAATW